MPKNHEQLNLVMFNMSTFYDWDHGIVNRNFNILQALEKEREIEKIVAVDFLPVGIKQAVSHYLKNILSEPKNHEMLYGDTTSACWQRSDKLYVYSTIDSLFSNETVGKELRRVEKILNLKNIVFWSYNPMFTNFIGKLNEKLFVFDTVDNWAEHPNYLKMIKKKKLLANYKVIAEKADVIFTVSEAMVDFFKDLGRTKDIHWIPNGVDYDHFNDPEKVEQENKLSEFTKPIIGYLGTIEERVDIDLIVKIAKHHSDKKIALCGPIWPGIKKELHEKIKGIENIHTFGRIDFDDAPSYLNKFNVAIIPHKLNKFVESMNPMKMYDYLACGKPVVATQGAGIDMFKDHIYIAKSENEFISNIDQALLEDSPEKREARKAAVKQHSWRERTDKMTEIVYKKLN
jgi:teichuronic acid biosynthesis glycosyltransferase TuaH